MLLKVAQDFSSPGGLHVLIGVQLSRLIFIKKNILYMNQFSDHMSQNIPSRCNNENVFYRYIRVNDKCPLQEG